MAFFTKIDKNSKIILKFPRNHTRPWISEVILRKKNNLEESIFLISTYHSKRVIKQCAQKSRREKWNKTESPDEVYIHKELIFTNLPRIKNVETTVSICKWNLKLKNWRKHRGNSSGSCNDQIFIYLFIYLFVCLFVFISFIHMCIQCLGHFSHLPPPPPFPLNPSLSPSTLSLPGSNYFALISNFVEKRG
jgi:hypothetical protein